MHNKNYHLLIQLLDNGSKIMIPINGYLLAIQIIPDAHGYPDNV